MTFSIPFKHITAPASTAIEQVTLSDDQATKSSLTQCSFATPTVVVKVGTPFKAFCVQENILQQSSDYFKTALKKEWREGQERVVELPEDDAQAFNVYLNFLYSKSLPLGYKNGQLPKVETNFRGLIHSYVLGDKLMDSDFKDAVVDAMCVSSYTQQDGSYILPHVDTRHMLYDMTRPGCKARVFLVHRMARTKERHLFLSGDQKEFLLDCLHFPSSETIDTTPETAASSASSCKFHEHAPGTENCYRTKYACTDA